MTRNTCELSGYPASRRSRRRSRERMRKVTGKGSYFDTGDVMEGGSPESILQDGGEMSQALRRKYKAVRSIALEEPEELGETAVIDTGMAFVKVCVRVCVHVCVCVLVSLLHPMHFSKTLTKATRKLTCSL